MATPKADLLEAALLSVEQVVRREGVAATGQELLRSHAPVLLTACLPTASHEAVAEAAATSSQEDGAVGEDARNSLRARSSLYARNAYVHSILKTHMRPAC